VERSTLLDVGLAYALSGRFEIGAHLPLYMQSGQVDASAQGSVRGVEAANGTALGKLKVHGKAQLWRGGGGAGDLVVGASAIAVLPTASARQYTGSGKPEGEVLLLGSFTPAALGARLSVSLNGGAVVRGETVFADIAQKSGIAWGAGASYRVAESLWATAELFGEATPSGRRADSSTAGAMSSAMLVQAEWLAGVSWRADRRFTVGVAAGRGLTDALGTPELRGVVSVAFTQGALAIAPIRSGIAQLRPDVDSDGDGIPDSVDKCPLEPEDKDMFNDDDGCPDLDNDGDGILDAQDKCPLDPEDKDGFEDVDGCPDKDNDGDGIPDAQDKCPNEPEDKDGFEDLDGCPDPDNDHDGIPDAQDKCPNEPETINGIKDDDGCPDKGDSTIVLSPDRIETLDAIAFNGLKLGRTALPLLGQVAATLRAHTEIIRVRVTVHVQPSGDTDADQAKSEKRAQAVRDWLVQWGIAPGRLDARGFGSAKPLVSPDQRGAAKINDRIEFIILERK
jgi:outer membrane protein OmpA-like peptidoglycan-associated protein